jgi:hypothetical protein
MQLLLTGFACFGLCNYQPGLLCNRVDNYIKLNRGGISPDESQDQRDNGDNQ